MPAVPWSVTRPPDRAGPPHGGAHGQPQTVRLPLPSGVNGPGTSLAPAGALMAGMAGVVRCCRPRLTPAQLHLLSLSRPSRHVPNTSRAGHGLAGPTPPVVARRCQPLGGTGLPRALPDGDGHDGRVSVGLGSVPRPAPGGGVLGSRAQLVPLRPPRAVGGGRRPRAGSGCSGGPDGAGPVRQHHRRGL